jgi:hypothetical protein
MTDFRTLCAELVDAYAWCVDNYMTASADRDSLVQRARAALALPEPVAAPSAVCTGCGTPRHEAISVIAAGSIACCPDCSTLTVEDRNAIRKVAALALPEPQGPTARPAIEPVPIAERLPGPEDCAQWPEEPGESPWCWFASEHEEGGWRWRQDCLCDPRAYGYTHWLPHHALPVPQQEVQ